MSDIKWILKEWDKLVPIKIYCSNFSRRKLWLCFCSKDVASFFIKSLPDNILNDIWVDKYWFVYINFKSLKSIK